MDILGHLLKKQKTSINTQKYLIENYCKDLQYCDPILFVDEGKSGWDSYLKRNSLITALNTLEENDLFVVKNIERLSRKYEDINIIKEIIHNKKAKLIETHPDNLDNLINYLKRFVGII